MSRRGEWLVSHKPCPVTNEEGVYYPRFVVPEKCTYQCYDWLFYALALSLDMARKHPRRQFVVINDRHQRHGCKSWVQSPRVYDAGEWELLDDGRLYLRENPQPIHGHGLVSGIINAAINRGANYYDHLQTHVDFTLL